MPTVDYSTYHQASGTGADGTKFSNFVDAVQTTINALDKNNLAANAGILASQLADPTTGKVLGSAASACAAVFPPGYEIGVDTLTAASTTISGLASGSATILIAGTSRTYDGTAVVAQFYAPALTVITGHTVTVGLYEDGTIKAVIVGPVINNTTANLQLPVGVNELEFTPAAGAHTYSVRAWTSSASADALIAGAGTGGAGAPAFLKLKKV